MSKVQIGINGFGRIGRLAFRAILGHYSDVLEVVGANDLAPVETCAHLLRHDTNYGHFPGTVESADDALIINGQKVGICSERDPAKLPWRDLGVDIVLECTGLFTAADRAREHLFSGAKKVVIAAPARGEDRTIVLGVNAQEIG
jgi:glyceraldehyde 3-phosphate dehydrogenase